MFFVGVSAKPGYRNPLIKSRSIEVGMLSKFDGQVRYYILYLKIFLIGNLIVGIFIFQNYIHGQNLFLKVSRYRSWINSIHSTPQRRDTINSSSCPSCSKLINILLDIHHSVYHVFIKAQLIMHLCGYTCPQVYIKL